MFTISLLGQKGGTGKTTISVGLSVAAALAGHPVAIIDPQATATKLKGRRSEDGPAVVAAQASRLPPTLATAEASGVEFAIIVAPVVRTTAPWPQLGAPTSC